jgi:hypothetical protein
VVEKNTSDDMIYNWRNELRSNQNGAVIVASSQANKYKTQGFTKSETIELLAADNYDLDLVNRVASKVYDAPEEQTKQVIEVAVVPTKYSDCAPIIERSLQKYSAKDFVKKLCIGPHAIVKTDDKGLGFWQRVAEIAKSSSQGVNNLHSALKPYIEEALLNNVLVAQSQKAEVKTASRNKYVVSMKNGTSEVDLLNATSSSRKFIEGNYSDFGLAYEYMVISADKVSTYSRLKRALAD